MPKTIQINIPTPCHQSWDEMTPDGHGRHCAHCSKTVIDFTTWSDATLYNFISKDKTNTCGRFLSTQLNRPIHIPPQPHSKLYKMAIAMGLTLIFSQNTEARAQTRPQTTANALYAKPFWQQFIDNNSYSLLHGSVSDQNNTPLYRVLVQAYQGISLKGQATTNLYGNYGIQHLKPGKYNLVFSYPEHDSLTICNVKAEEKNPTPQNVILPVSETEVIITNGLYSPEVKVPRNIIRQAQ